MVKSGKDMRMETRENMRGGDGKVDLLHILEKEEMLNKAIMCAIVTLKKGCGIGEHSHSPEAEIYYVLEGKLTVTDNDETKYLEAGDVMFTGNGNRHSARNEHDQQVKMMAIVLA